MSQSTKYQTKKCKQCRSKHFKPSQAHQLEEKEKDLKKRDALYKEHIAKLEAKVSIFINPPHLM